MNCHSGPQLTLAVVNHARKDSIAHLLAARYIFPVNAILELPLDEARAYGFVAQGQEKNRLA